MDKKSKILIWFFVASVVSLFAFNYYRIVVLHNYSVKAYTSCDPNTHTCFKYVCTEEDAEDCEDEIYGKIISNIRAVDLCDQYNEECDDLVCEEGEDDCTIIYCSEESLADGEVCTTPETDGTLIAGLPELEIVATSTEETEITQ
jgi:hypothetical protein